MSKKNNNDNENENTKPDNKTEVKEKKPVEVYAERGESDTASIELADVRAAALAYAKYLKENGLEPGDATFVEPEELNIELADAAVPEETAETKAEETSQVEEAEKKKKPEKAVKRRRRRKKIKVKPLEQRGKGVKFLSSVIDARDKGQNMLDEGVIRIREDFSSSIHKMTDSYRNTRRSMGIALLTICLMVAAELIIFDKFTVYEYAYNGKVLGYVKEQEEVTEVLKIAGTKLTENNGNNVKIEFVPNRNVTFNLVESTGKSVDNADVAVNKLVYMTDIETEAYGVYDGDKIVAVVKSNNDAEDLLDQTMDELSTPDDGMKLESAEFINPLDIRPINVLLTSVQDSTTAREQMVKGGAMEVYHIMEEEETLEEIASEFGVTTGDIYNEKNEEVAVEVEQGDKVCIHCSVEPVNVKMVESGRMRETIEFKTVKKESDEYYKGDTVIEQEGVDGVQIFEGTITKEGGEVVDRETVSEETIREVRDKIILVGTAERPKTAPTGTYAMPIQRYTLTSYFGGRWGRMHEGIDMAAPTGTPIYATDGGTVLRAGVYGGYGNCIDIDHENGRVSRYGHCSQLLVNAGEKVYQGQLIGLVGNTGNSFGSHLHFEIRINGTARDPIPYLGL